MIRRHATVLRLVLAAGDATAAILIVLLAGIIRFGTSEPLDPIFVVLRDPWLAIAIYAVAWPVALWSQGLYRPRARLRLTTEIVDIVRATVIFAAVILSLLFLFKLPDISRAVLAVVFPALAVAALAIRLVQRWALTELRARGRNTRFVLVVGTSAAAQSYADLVEGYPALGLRIFGHLSTEGNGEAIVTRPVLGSLADIERVLHANVVDEVAICLPVGQWPHIDDIARLCEDEGKIVRIPMYHLEHALAAGRVEDLSGVPIYSIVAGPDRVVGMVAKRVLDIVGGVLGLVILSPVMIAIAITVRRDSPGPILFRQQRVGLHGRRFDVLKFRTMIAGAEEQLADLVEFNEIRGHAFKITDDPRITGIGRSLRSSSLDELPQLWNVLLGQMSLVGPRPPLPSEVADYDVWHRRRLSMKPGITGLWQVRARGEPDFDRWVETDLEYIDGWSFWLDLRIIAGTVPAVMGRSGR